MAAPFVSVIMPVYNVRPFLREALDSVIRQTYRNLEIIVIDDGSTDGSGQICDQYQQKDHRIRVIHQENKGLSSARNTGLDVMHGEFVAFLDPDDAFLPDMIEHLLRAMLQTGADIAACSYYFCQTDGKMNPSHAKSSYRLDSGCVPKNKALNLMLDGRISINVWNKLYRRQIFDHLRFPDGHVFEDQIITPFLIDRAEHVVMRRQPLLLHRLNRPGSITASISEKNSLDWLYAAKIKENFVSTHTPAVFSHQKQAQYEDALFRLILWWYTRLLTFTAIREKTKRAFEHEIESRARNIGAYSAKSRATYYFYRLTPRLCFCTKQTCAAFKNHVKCLLHAGHA